MSWEDVMSGLTKKRKREEEMEGEIGDLATENALLKAEVKKLKLEKKSLQEGEAKEKMKVIELENGKKDLLAEISHMKGQKANVEANNASGPTEKKDYDTPVFHFAIPPKVERLREIQGKTDLGKASETNIHKGWKDDWMSTSFKAWMDSDARNRPGYDEQKKTTSGEVKENNQDEVVIIEETVKGGKVIIFQEDLLNYKKAVEEVKKGKQVLEELQMLVECPVCMTTPKEGPMPCCPAGHLVCAPCLLALKKKGKKICPSCRGPLGKGKSLLSNAIIKTIEEERSSPQPGPSNSVLSSPAPKNKEVKAIKQRVLAPALKVGKGSPVLAKKKPSIGAGAVARFEGTCPLCGEKFMDAVLLETHASECNGGGEPEQAGASTASAPLQKQFGGFLDLRRESSDDSDD